MKRDEFNSEVRRVQVNGHGISRQVSDSESHQHHPQIWGEDFQVSADGSVLKARKPRVLDDRETSSPLIVEHGVLIPLAVAFRKKWLVALAMTAKAGKASIAQIANPPGTCHAYLKPTLEPDVIAVYLESPVLCDASIFEAYAELYQLTQAERKVLWKLANGTEPKQIATDNGVSEHTIRTHVKAILAKVGEKNIRATLIRLGKLSLRFAG